MGLDPERKRSHVEEDDVLDVALENAALNSRAHRYDLVRVDLAVRSLAENPLDRAADDRATGLAAHE